MRRDKIPSLVIIVPWPWALSSNAPPPPSQKKKKKKTNWETTGVGQGCGKDAHGQDGLTGVKLGVPGIRLRVDQRKGSKGCQREALGLGI